MDHYSILCGSFLFTPPASPGDFQPWTNRISKTDLLLAYLKKTYHEPYFNTLFGIDTNSQHVVHQTDGSLQGSPMGFHLKVQPEHQFQISWFDRYLFPSGLGIFAFKVTAHTGTTASNESLNTLIRHARNMDCPLSLEDGEQLTLAAFIRKYVEPGLVLSEGWDRYLNRLKHYTIINDNSTKTITPAIEHTLFELAHAMPPGAVGSSSTESPTEEYYQKVFREQSIEVYANWKAIALLDSFTRLSVRFDDVYRSWELDYFHIYVYCLFCKYRLYQFNDELTAASKDKKKAVSLKAAFEAFLTDAVPSAISYKFLPNLIFEKMFQSLEIEKEINSLEKKMNRLTVRAEREQVEEPRVRRTGSSILPEFSHDVYISYHDRDNKHGWITQFAEDLQDELSSLMKDPILVHLRSPRGESEAGAGEISPLNTLIFLPVLSPGYCNPAADPWKNELLAFRKLAEESPFGMDIGLRGGNVSGRILPVCIYELEDEDRLLYDRELGRTLRSIDFIYREPGINRPLKSDDIAPEGSTRISYRNQMNKLANAIKEVIRGMKNSVNADRR